MNDKIVLNVRIRQKVASLVNDEEYIVCGNDNYAIKFDFDDDFAGYKFKTAVFVSQDDKVTEEVVFEGDTCNVPPIYNSTLINVGVIADNVRTTTPAYVKCKLSISDIAGKIKPPTEDVYNQIMALLNQYIENGVSEEQIKQYIYEYLQEYDEMVTEQELQLIISKVQEDIKANVDYIDEVSDWAAEEIESINGTLASVETDIDNVQADIVDVEDRLSYLESFNLQYTEVVSDNGTIIPPSSEFLGRKAFINFFGGMTYKSNNLFDKDNPNAIQCGFYDDAGIYGQNSTSIYIPCKPNTTYTISKQGNITNSFLRLGTTAEIPDIGGSIIDFAMGSGDISSLSLTTSTNAKYLLAMITNSSLGSANIQEVYDSIQINIGDTALPYEPYFEGLLNTKTTEIRSYDANKSVIDTIPIPAEIQDLNGYGEGISLDYYNKVDLENDTYVKNIGRYVFTGSEKITSYGAGNKGGYCYRVTADADLRDSALAEVTLLADKYTAVKNTGGLREMSVGTIKEYGYRNDIDIVSSKATETEFRQELAGTILYYALPTSITSPLTQEVKTLVFNGTESWDTETNTVGNIFRISLTDKPLYEGTDKMPNIVCTHYNAVKYYDLKTGSEGVSVYVNRVLIFDNDFASADVSTWKAHLAELYANGTPLTVTYALQTPITIEIDGLIEVEEGGYIEAVTDTGRGVPISATFVVPR